MKKIKANGVILFSFLFLINNYTNILAQSLPEMVKVEGGTFVMGGDSSKGNTEARPAHTVTLTTFYMAKTPTTIVQWRTFCNATGRPMPDTPSWGWHDNDPIVFINRFDAIAYCSWLCGKTGKIYRLPTEAEFEYAAKGGNKSKGYKYSGSDSLNDCGWYRDNSEKHAHPVAMKMPNELGLYDMSGNVWEWCSDWFGRYDSLPSTNPKGPPGAKLCVIRGGSWNEMAPFERVVCRGSLSPLVAFGVFGFRVVLEE
jgi:formylglycine-generating enzyme required for sulfatase activity